MAEWRITEQNPVRDIDGLDVERCAALHNLIIARGWQESGRPMSALDRRTWWDLYVSDPAATPVSLDFLGPDVVAFLQSAQVGHAADLDDSHASHAFHRYLDGLTVPEMLNENAVYDSDEDDSNKRRYLTLYFENPYLYVNHSGGLLYDQIEHRAVHVGSLDDAVIVQNGRQQWLPLEVILEGYLQMMDQGKVKAVGPGYDGKQETAHPWIMPSYTELDLAQAIGAWNNLVTEIECRMGLGDQTADAVTTGLPEGFYARLNLSRQSFAKRFFQGVQKPRFTFLAPGLRLATQQPFAEVQVGQEEHKLRPSLLLENDLPACTDFDESPYGPLIIRNFDRDLERALPSRLPAGLYLTESNSCSWHPWEDGVKLLLPFALGSNRFARRSDNSLLGEELFHEGPAPGAQPRSSELYQSGWNPYIRLHDVQLAHVLMRWSKMVREEKWEVGEDGVMGGIEKWREADTEAFWADYTLPRTW